MTQTHLSYKNTSQRGQTTAIIVGIIAVAALGIAWWAFNRTGDETLPQAVDDQFEDIGDEVSQRAGQDGDVLGETADDAGQAADQIGENVKGGFNAVLGDETLSAAVGSAREQLVELQTDLETDPDYAAAADEVAAIEADLQTTFSDASAEAQDFWVNLQGEFDDLEAELRSGTADSLDRLGNLIDNLEADVRVDTETNVNTDTNVNY